MKRIHVIIFFVLVVFMFPSCSGGNKRKIIMGDNGDNVVIINDDNVHLILGWWQASPEGPWYRFNIEEGVKVFGYREGAHTDLVETGNFGIDNSQMILHATKIGVPGWPQLDIDTYKTVNCYRKSDKLIIDEIAFSKY